MHCAMKIFISLVKLGLAFQLLLAAFTATASQNVPWNEIQRMQREMVEPASALGNVFLGLVDEAVLLYRKGEVDEGIKVAAKALELARERGGDNHMGAALAATILARFAVEKGDIKDALNLQRYAMRIWERSTSKQSSIYIRGLLTYGDILLASGSQAEAKQQYEEALQRAENFIGDNYPLIGGALARLGDLYRQQGQNRLATAMYRRAIANFHEASGDYSQEISNLKSKIQE
jgi:tetratricopeptide (TPR) repeat protein